MKLKLKVFLLFLLFSCSFSKIAQAVTANNFLETYTLLASDASDGNIFGASVAMGGDVVAVGALEGEKVYIYSFIEGQLTEQLIASEGNHPNSFGSSVAINGNIVAVGARGEGTTGEGAVYVYTYANGSWGTPIIVTPNDAQTGDGFGSEVRLQNDLMVVGAATVDVSGHENSGAAYVFTLSNGTWQQTAKLVPSDPVDKSFFGVSVAIDQKTIVVGAPGDVDNPSLTNVTGAAYVFELTNGIWTQTAKLVSANSANDDFLAQSVAIQGDVIALGAPLGNSTTGSVVLFNRQTNGSWQEGQTLLANDGKPFDFFGYSIALDDDVLAIGAPEDLNGSPDNVGAVYIFALNNSTWSQTQSKLFPSGAQIGDLFGYSVALDNFILLAGAPVASGMGAFQGAAFFFTQAAVIADPTEFSLEPGEQGTYSLFLNSEPANDVIVTPTNSSISFNPSSVTFTTSNWATPQSITFTAPNPSSSIETFTINHTVTSIDSLFNGIEGPEVNVLVASPGTLGGGKCSVESHGEKNSPSSWIAAFAFLSLLYVGMKKRLPKKIM